MQLVQYLQVVPLTMYEHTLYSVHCVQCMFTLIRLRLHFCTFVRLSTAFLFIYFLYCCCSLLLRYSCYYSWLGACVTLRSNGWRICMIRSLAVAPFPPAGATLSFGNLLT